MTPNLMSYSSAMRGDVRQVSRLLGTLCAIAVSASVAASLAAAETWVPIGPRGNLGPAVGEQCIGRIASIQIDATTGNLYVGASSGGLWRTSPDPTGSPPVWQDLGANLPHPSVGAIAVHPSFPDDILVGTGDSGREGFDGGEYLGGAGIFHTTDAGQNWTRVLPATELGQPPATVFRLLYQPGSTDVILAATSTGLYRTVTGPTGTWTLEAPGMFTDLVFKPSNADTVFACVVFGSQDTGIYKSVDGGQTWNVIKLVSPAARGAIAICRHTPSTLASIWESGLTVSAVLRSVDGGTTWPNLPTAPGIIGANANAGDVLAIAIAPNNPSQIYIGASNPWWTLDGGQNWVTNPPLPIARHADVTQLYWSPIDDNALWICNDGGVYRYPLGADHSDSFNGDASGGLQISQIYRIAARRNLRFAAMQDDGINGSLDGGGTWKTFHIADYLVDGSDVVITDPSDVNPAFWFIYGIDNGGYPLARGTFGGTLKKVTQPPPVPPISGVYDDRFGASGSGRVFSVRWSNGTASELISYPLLANDTTESIVEATGPIGVEGITGSWLDGQTFYLWVKKPSLVTPPNAFNLLVYRRSGPAWNMTQQLIGGPGGTKSVKQVHASRLWPGEAWAVLDSSAVSPRVYHSTDYGVTWTDITGDLRFLSIGSFFTIVASPFDSKELYVGTGRGGVFRTLDGGVHWESFRTGLPRVSVHDMAYVTDESHDGTDKLVIGTYGRGMYECSLDRTGPVYVDQRNVTPPWLGTLEDPVPTIQQGIIDTPFFGRMLLNGSLIYAGPRTLAKPMKVGSYEFPAHVGP